MLGFGYREEKNEPEAVFIQEALALLQDKIALVSFRQVFFCYQRTNPMKCTDFPVVCKLTSFYQMCKTMD